MNQLERNMWLPKCLLERILHVCLKLSSLTTLWTLMQSVHPLWYARKQSALDNTEDRSELYPKCKVKCQNNSNVLRRKRKAVIASDLKKK